jgi:hypothetical protein
MNANEIYFTRGTKRAQRLGDTLVVVTEGARVTITLQDDGQPAKVTVAKTTPRAAKPAAAATATAPKTATARPPRPKVAVAAKPAATTRVPNATTTTAPKATPAKATARTTRARKTAA